jgi:hypothetical protein
MKAKNILLKFIFMSLLLQSCQNEAVPGAETTLAITTAQPPTPTIEISPTPTFTASELAEHEASALIINHILEKGYIDSSQIENVEIVISQGSDPDANSEFQSVTFAVVKIPGRDNLILWNGGVDENGNLVYGDTPDVPGLDLTGHPKDARLFELWLPAGVTLGQLEIGGAIKLMLVDEDGGQPIAGLHRFFKFVGAGDGDDIVPNSFLIDDKGIAHPDVLLEIVDGEDGNKVIQVEGYPEAKFDVGSNQWQNLDSVLAVSASAEEASETGVSSSVASALEGIDGVEFSDGKWTVDGHVANMVELESGQTALMGVENPNMVYAVVDENDVAWDVNLDLMAGTDLATIPFFKEKYGAGDGEFTPEFFEAMAVIRRLTKMTEMPPGVITSFNSYLTFDLRETVLEFEGYSQSLELRSVVNMNSRTVVQLAVGFTPDNADLGLRQQVVEFQAVLDESPNQPSSDEQVSLLTHGSQMLIVMIPLNDNLNEWENFDELIENQGSLSVISWRSGMSMWENRNPPTKLFDENLLMMMVKER